MKLSVKKIKCLNLNSNLYCLKSEPPTFSSFPRRWESRCPIPSQAFPDSRFHGNDEKRYFLLLLEKGGNWVNLFYDMQIKTALCWAVFIRIISAIIIRSLLE